MQNLSIKMWSSKVVAQILNLGIKDFLRKLKKWLKRQWVLTALKYLYLHFKMISFIILYQILNKRISFFTAFYFLKIFSKSTSVHIAMKVLYIFPCFVTWHLFLVPTLRSVSDLSKLGQDLGLRSSFTWLDSLSPLHSLPSPLLSVFHLLFLSAVLKP